MRVLLALACLAAGLLTGITGAFVQADRSFVALLGAELVVPWGMVLVIAVLVAVVRGGVWALGTRAGGWLVLGGWLLATVGFATESPGGDLAIAGGGREWVYVIAGTIAGSVAAMLPRIVRA